MKNNLKIPCIVKYKNNLNFCKMRIYNDLSEDHTVINILIFLNHFPVKLILHKTKITINKPIKKSKTKKNRITVCVGKMINYTAYNMLIQMIESYLYFGIDHFVIYKSSCNINVDRVLSYYSKKGILDIVIWKNDFDIINAKYKTYGQRVKLNDCLYRNYYSTYSIIITDLDEILWPKNEDNIINMIKNIDKKVYNKYDTYIFREKIFKREYISYFDRYIHNIDDCNIFDYHNCCDYTWEWPKLYLRNLSNIISLSIHQITKYINNYSEVKINSNIGYIRHTRRIYPYLISGLNGKWSLCKSDKRESIIMKQSQKIKKLLGI